MSAEHCSYAKSWEQKKWFIGFSFWFCHPIRRSGHTTACSLSVLPKFSKYTLNIKYVLIYNGHRDQPLTGLIYPWDESCLLCQPNCSPSLHFNCISSFCVHLPVPSQVLRWCCRHGVPGRDEPSGHPVPGAGNNSSVGGSQVRLSLEHKAGVGRWLSAGHQLFLKFSASLWIFRAVSHVLKSQDIIWEFQCISEKSSLLFFFF